MIRTEELPAIEEIAVEIGGTPVLLRTHDAAFHELVQQRYGGFLGKGTSPTVTFDVQVARPEDALSHEQELRVWDDQGLWRLMRGDFRAEWDPESGGGQILQTMTPYAIDSFLRVLHTLIQAPEGGFLLHAERVASTAEQGVAVENLKQFSRTTACPRCAHAARSR